jgi:NADH:ubiquinone oxidoreductase subunit 5 (subunit L)/multisubunit Na+/H+ antiporter MnhA subunit
MSNYTARRFISFLALPCSFLGGFVLSNNICLVLFGFSSTSGKIIIIYIVLTDYNYRGYLEIAYLC